MPSFAIIVRYGIALKRLTNAALRSQLYAGEHGSVNLNIWRMPRDSRFEHTSGVASAEGKCRPTAFD
jgi:hypothetical protein